MIEIIIVTAASAKTIQTKSRMVFSGDFDFSVFLEKKKINTKLASILVTIFSFCMTNHYNFYITCLSHQILLNNWTGSI